MVQLSPLTPEDPIPDLDERLAELRALGPMEFDPGEQEAIFAELQELDRISEDAMDCLGGDKP